MKGRLQSAVEEDEKVRSSKEEEMLCRLLMHLSDPPCHFLQLCPTFWCTCPTLSLLDAVGLCCFSGCTYRLWDPGQHCHLWPGQPSACWRDGRKTNIARDWCFAFHWFIHMWRSFVYILYMCVSELDGCNAGFKASREVPLMKVCPSERPPLC